jgi:hypothetical protein
MKSMCRAVAWSGLLLVLLGGCPGTSTEVDAGRDAAEPVGLRFAFRVDPELEEEIGGNVTVRSISLELRDLRAFGDSAPGDVRTTLEALDVAFAGGQDSVLFELPQAPPGLYSRLDLRVERYTVRGVVSSGGSERTFEVQDGQPLALSVALDHVELPGGERITVELEVRADFISSIDWSSVTPDGEGVLRVGTGDVRLTPVRLALAGAIREHD